MSAAAADRLTQVAGYVLAGGRSSRMGRDKAWLELAGKPLVEIAVEKLRRVCAVVCVLSADQTLGGFAPIVPDLHPHCGPLSGLEAALAHSDRAWSLLIAVDMPFFPVSVLRAWAATVLARESVGARAALLIWGGFPQPAVLLVHRDLLPCVEQAIAAGVFKLYKVLRDAADEIAAGAGARAADVLIEMDAASFSRYSSIEIDRWFLNLNTPEEFERASEAGLPASDGE